MKIEVRRKENNDELQFLLSMSEHQLDGSLMMAIAHTVAEKLMANEKLTKEIMGKLTVDRVVHAALPKISDMIKDKMEIKIK